MSTIAPGLDTLLVKDAMSDVDYTVTVLTKMDQVAQQFIDRKINSAPVVDDVDRCIGIVTSADIVRFQSLLSDANARIDHGMSIDVVRRESDGSIEIVSHPFDEVGRHMTTALQTVEADCSLRVASSVMWQQHKHHLLVLDDLNRPSGILSSLDILAKLNGDK